ncbi:MAG: four helix bundle protein [Clostridium sp.]
MLDILELVIMLENKHYKKTTLGELDTKVDVLRHLIRLAASTKYTRSGKPCLPMKKYEMMARYINEIGCMVGGYYKSLNGSTSGNGSAAK